MPKFNYISLLAIFSIPAFTVLFNDVAPDWTISLSFGYLLYLGYIKTPMDELFLKRVQQAASLTLLIIGLTMSGIFIAVYWAASSERFIFTSYWIVFMLIHVIFNVSLTVLLTLDAKGASNA
jgi:hypothetical protein